MAWTAKDEAPHAGLVDEWVFAAWLPDASLGVVSGHRLLADRSWYWAVLVEGDRPLMHLAEWEIPVRRDPFVLKAPEMWAEHHCDDPLRQWSIGNEAYFVEMEDAAEALGRCFGRPTPLAMDLEFYGFGDPAAIVDGYEQPGVVHGEIELLHRPNIELAEIPAHRWRRWGVELGPLQLAASNGDERLRAPVMLPDGSILDWVLSKQGWRSR